MSKFDFNTDNYTKEELLDFFFDSDNESNDLDNYKIKEKANKLRRQAVNNNENDLVNFINKVETIILKMNNDYLETETDTDTDTDTDEKSLDDDDDNKKMDDANYVFTKELMEGTLNPTYKQIITRLVNVDSQYKGIIEENNANTTDYTFELTETLTNVTSISLYSVEIPYSWYTFDESYGTNILKIDEKEFKISSGNYSPESLVKEMNRVINVDISCELISSSGKIIFKNKSSKDVSIRFFSETDIAFTNAKVNSNLGWLMGFRKEEILLYRNTDISGDSPLDVWGPRYIYMLLDDYNNNQSSKALIGITKADNNVLPTTITEPVNRVLNGINSKDVSIQQNTTLKTIPNNILEAENLKNQDRNKKLKPRYSSPVNSNYFAKIPLKISRNWNNNYSVPFIEFTGQIQKNKREYFGPINIKKMRVTLLDDKGNILNINGLDWSFSLQTTHVYQYGTPVSL
tara:strand:+ start:2560 stop:3939 length:1380 start_codon:yes stop_codon:yes gene_type:complete